MMTSKREALLTDEVSKESVLGDATPKSLPLDRQSMGKSDQPTESLETRTEGLLESQDPVLSSTHGVHSGQQTTNILDNLAPEAWEPCYWCRNTSLNRETSHADTEASCHAQTPLANREPYRKSASPSLERVSRPDTWLLGDAVYEIGFRSSMMFGLLQKRFASSHNWQITASTVVLSGQLYQNVYIVRQGFVLPCTVCNSRTSLCPRQASGALLFQRPRAV
jgi:hypothetical protein